MNNARLYDGIRAIPINGLVKIEGDLLLFENAELKEPHAFPLQHFCEVQKIDGRLQLEFRSPQKKSVSIILEIFNPDFEDELQQGFKNCGGFTAFRQLIWYRLPIYFWLIALVLFFPLGYLGYTRGAEELHRFIPVVWEERLGESVEDQVAFFYPPHPNHPRQKLLQHMADQLADPDSPYILEVSVVYSYEVNAFALPGGKIMVTTGLLELTQDPNEWAAIISHEVAHVEKRHVMRSLSRAAGTLYLFSMTIGGGLEGFGAGEQALELSSTLLNLQYSRAMEKEADRVGIEKLLTIGKDPRGFISFFQRLQSGDPTDERMRLLSTHPRHEDRIRSLENLIPKNQMYADWSVD